MRLLAALSTVAALAAAVVGGAARGAGTLPSFTPCVPVKPAIRPAEVVIACGDGNFYVSKLEWSRWTATGASAAGTAHVNDCKPYCAAGHFHAYAISLRLTRPRTCAHGRREFTRFTYRFPASKPADIPRTATERSGGTGCP